MKRIISAIIMITMLCMTVPTPQMAVFAQQEVGSGSYKSGDGSKDNPYIISTAEELMYFSAMVNTSTPELNSDICSKIDGTYSEGWGKWINAPYKEFYSVYKGKYFKLENDIDLEGAQWSPIGDDDTHLFDGYFDGDGHIVKNFTVSTYHTKIGFFGLTGQNVTIKNLGIENAEYIYQENNDRVRGVGGLVGVVSGGLIENCYVKNIKFENKHRYNHANAVGGLIGQGVSLTFGSNKQAIINNCYVSKVSFKESPTTTGAFMGMDYTNAFIATEFPTDHEYYADSSHKLSAAYWANYNQWFKIYIKVSNCYVQDVSFTDTNDAAGLSNPYSFARNSQGAFTATNCFTALEEKNTNAPLINKLSDKADIVKYLVTDEGAYTRDNPIENINGGFPVHKIFADWIKGTETNVLEENFLNNLTNGQAKEYIFDDLNFISDFEYEGKVYKVGWNSENEEIITNSGSVIKKKNPTDVKVSAIIYCETTNEYFYDDILLTVAENGEKLMRESFDALQSSQDLLNNGWQYDDISLEAVQSVTNQSDDKMLKISPSGGNKMLTSILTPQNSDGKYKLLLNFLLPDESSSFSVHLGGENYVTVSRTALTIGDKSTSVSSISDSSWNVLDITLDLNKNAVGANINKSESVTQSAENLTNESFGIVEKNENFYIDNVIYYETVLGELDLIDYDNILGGQSRYMVTTNLNLPAETIYKRAPLAVEWSSSDENIISSDGTVKKVNESKKVTLTAKTRNSEGDVSATKNFTIYVSPKGSSLLFAEDFETATVEGQGIQRFNSKYERGATNDWVHYTIEKSPTSSPTQTFSEADKVFMVERIKEDGGTDTSPVENVYMPLDRTTYDGLIEICYDIYYTELTSWPIFRLRNVSNATITELYDVGNNGWFSNASILNGDSRVTWTHKQSGKWVNWRILMNTADKTFEVWVDGIKSAQVSKYDNSNDALLGISFGSERFRDKIGKWYIDNIVVRDLMPEPGDAVKIAAENISMPDEVTNDIFLPSEGEYSTQIIWKSSDKNIISESGLVNAQGSDVNVTLTAIVVKDNYKYTKDFDIIVKSDGGETNAGSLMSTIAKNFTFNNISNESQYFVTENLNLISTYDCGDAGKIGGVNVSWESDATDVISLDGTVHRQSDDRLVNLTATLSKDGVSEKKTFKIYVVRDRFTNMVRESFDDYEESLIGESIDNVPKWNVQEPSTGVSTVTSKLWRDYENCNNKILNVTRSGYKDAADQNAVLDVGLGSSDLLTSMMIKLGSENDTVNIQLNGVDTQIIVKKKVIIVGGVEISVNLPIGEWFKLSFYMDEINKNCAVYVDEKNISNISMAFKETPFVNSIVFLNKHTDLSGGTWFIDECIVMDISLSDAEAVESVRAQLQFPTEIVEWDIENLISKGQYGTIITWQSSDPETMEDNGTVHRSVGPDKSLKMIANIQRGSVSKSKEFTITVKGLSGDEVPAADIFEGHVKQIDYSYFTNENPQRITKDLKLPTQYHNGNCEFYGGMNISWSSDMPHVVSKEGKVTRQVYDVPVKLTATYTSIRKPDVSQSVSYEFVVWASGDIAVYEDFERFDSSYEGVKVADADPDHWTTEVFGEEFIGQKTFISKDYLDSNKSWEEANKVVCVNRYRKSDECTRSQYYFDKKFSNPDAVAISFKVMLDSEKSSAWITLAGLGQIVIFSSYIRYLGDNVSIYPITPRKWTTITVVILRTAEKHMLLQDGKLLATGESKSKIQIDNILIDIERNYGAYTFWFDDVIVREFNDSDEAAVNAAADLIDLQGGRIESDIALPFIGENRTQISYKSTKPNVLTDNGMIINPADKDEPVTLNAFIKRGNAMIQKSFDFIVAKQDGSEAYCINNFDIKDKKLSSVSVNVKNTSYNEPKLIVELYNQGTLKEVRSVDLTGIPVGNNTIAIKELDFSDVEYYEVKGYVISKNKILSNVRTVTY